MNFPLLLLAPDPGLQFMRGAFPLRETRLKADHHCQLLLRAPALRAKKVMDAAVSEETPRLQLYSDPESRLLREALAKHYNLQTEQLLVGNGSDELLNFAFMAFCDENRPAFFPDITYGFYPVYASLNHIPYQEIPLREDLSFSFEDIPDGKGTVFLANPNAPTGIAKSAAEIEQLLQKRQDSVLVVDEAYVDFGAVSVLPLVNLYDNLLVIQTFSKSRSMAGARLGFAAGCAELIRDLNTLKYSTNPYNVNRMTSAAGIAALQEDTYYRENARIIGENRDFTTNALRELGFFVPDSKANFIFARSEQINGGKLYRDLKERGILVRHFDKPRIENYVRITIGTREQMKALLKEIKAILEEQ